MLIVPSPLKENGSLISLWDQELEVVTVIHVQHVQYVQY